MMQQIYNIATQLLREAVYAKMHWQLMVVLCISITMSLFAAELALTDADNLRLTILADFLRLLMVFVFIVFVVTSSIREFEEGRVAHVLAGPTPRWLYWAGRALAVLLLALIFSLVSGATLFVFSQSLNLLLWMLSLFFELLLMGLAAIFFSFSFRHLAPAISAVFSFYILARILDSFQSIIANSLSLNHELLWTQFFTGFVTLLSHIVPALDQFGQSSWLLAGSAPASALPMLLSHAVIYSALLAAASLFDLYRKELL